MPSSHSSTSHSSSHRSSSSTRSSFSSSHSSSSHSGFSSSRSSFGSSNSISSFKSSSPQKKSSSVSSHSKSSHSDSSKSSKKNSVKNNYSASYSERHNNYKPKKHYSYSEPSRTYCSDHYGNTTQPPSRRHYSSIPPVSIVVDRTHQYRRFDTTWTDSDDVKHSPGYYDENDTRHDGVYSPDDANVVCYCSYCGNTTSFNTRTTTEFQCSSCGAAMDVVKAEPASNSAPASAPSARHTDDYTIENTPWYVRGLIIAAVVIICWIVGSLISISTPDGTISLSETGVERSYAVNDDTVNFEVNDPIINSMPHYDEGRPTTIYLTPTIIDNCYSISPEVTADYSIAMRWDGENYYDNTSDYYAYYNTDVSPAMWQYWYEPISSDFGDYGWIEYDETTRDWVIEVDYDQWEVIPNSYDTSSLYYIVN